MPQLTRPPSVLPPLEDPARMEQIRAAFSDDSYMLLRTMIGLQVALNEIGSTTWGGLDLFEYGMQNHILSAADQNSPHVRKFASLFPDVVNHPQFPAALRRSTHFLVSEGLLITVENTTMSAWLTEKGLDRILEAMEHR